MPNCTCQLPAVPENGRLLVIGSGNGLMAKQLESGSQSVAYLPFLALDAASLLQAAPDLVVCALFAADMATGDAIAMVERLERLHYRGRILVICPALPSLAMIEAELQILGPGQRLSLIAQEQS